MLPILLMRSTPFRGFAASKREISDGGSSKLHGKFWPIGKTMEKPWKKPVVWKKYELRPSLGILILESLFPLIYLNQGYMYDTFVLEMISLELDQKTFQSRFPMTYDTLVWFRYSQSYISNGPIPPRKWFIIQSTANQQFNGLQCRNHGIFLHRSS